MGKQNLTIINLDSLIAVDASIKANLQRSALEDLENKMMDNPHTIYMENTEYLFLFGLISEQPQEAIELLEKAARYHCSSSEQQPSEYFEKAVKCEKAFVEEAKQNLFHRFSEERISGPDLHWWITCELLAVIQDNPLELLKFFQKCYEQIIENNKKTRMMEDDFSQGWDEKFEETRTVVQALKTRDFYGKIMLVSDLILKSNPLDLYKKNSSDFIQYFSRIEDIKERNAVLRLLLDCDNENKEVIDWLNKNHDNPIRDAAFEPCSSSVDKSYMKHLGMTFIPQEEVIQVPKRYLEDYVVLSKYLMELEGASLDSIGLIKPPEKSSRNHRTIIIPRKGDVDWREGLYIIKNSPWYFDVRRNYRVYKTEKYHTDKELICKTTKEGNMFRYTHKNKDFQFLFTIERPLLEKERKWDYFLRIAKIKGKKI